MNNDLTDDVAKRRLRFDIKHLKYFATVAEEGSFRKAAERLNISQPPLGRQIQKLEHGVGAALFERTRNGVVLTAAGTELLVHARRILENCYHAAEQVSLVNSGLVGSLVCCFADEFSYGDLALCLADFHSQYPKIDLQIHMDQSTDIVTKVEAGSCDVGFVFFPLSATATGIETEVLAPMPLVVAVNANHPLADRQAATISDFRDETFICGTVTSLTPFMLQVMSLFKKAKVAPRFLKNVKPLEFRLDLVAAGVGVVITTMQTRRPQNPDIRYINLVDEGAVVTGGLIWSRGAQQRDSVRLFLELARSRILPDQN
ncbi:MAG: LysR family transcriptional regulator [Pseudomonadota bacterium]